MISWDDLRRNPQPEPEFRCQFRRAAVRLASVPTEEIPSERVDEHGLVPRKPHAGLLPFCAPFHRWCLARRRRCGLQLPQRSRRYWESRRPTTTPVAPRAGDHREQTRSVGCRETLAAQGAILHRVSSPLLVQDPQVTFHPGSCYQLKNHMSAKAAPRRSDGSGLACRPGPSRGHHGRRGIIARLGKLSESTGVSQAQPRGRRRRLVTHPPAEAPARGISLPGDLHHLSCVGWALRYRDVQEASMRRGVARQTGTAYTSPLTQKEGGPAADFVVARVLGERSRRDETARDATVAPD
jgi:hypothetical protein